jgi:hypothetical protein
LCLVGCYWGLVGPIRVRSDFKMIIRPSLRRSKLSYAPLPLDVGPDGGRITIALTRMISLLGTENESFKGCSRSSRLIRWSLDDDLPDRGSLSYPRTGPAEPDELLPSLDMLR